MGHSRVRRSAGETARLLWLMIEAGIVGRRGHGCSDPYLRQPGEAAPSDRGDTTVEHRADGPVRTVVQMPAQPLLSPLPLVDRVAVINQQLESRNRFHPAADG
jgi:hypothetical protein